MATTVKQIQTVEAFSFMGLMAANGQVPGAVCGSRDKEFFFAATEEAAIELALDLTAKGDFFSLMTRPSSLGGGFGGMGGGAFGGGALAH